MSQFTPGEIEVMQVLWEHGELKPPEIQQRFPRPINDMTLRSFLRVLMEKGHVERRKKGRAYYYRPITPRRSALHKMTRRMAEVFTGGSRFALIAEMIETEDLSEEHIQELRKIADRRIPRDPGEERGRLR